MKSKSGLRVVIERVFHANLGGIFIVVATTVITWVENDDRKEWTRLCLWCLKGKNLRIIWNTFVDFQKKNEKTISGSNSTCLENPLTQLALPRLGSLYEVTESHDKHWGYLLDTWQHQSQGIRQIFTRKFTAVTVGSYGHRTPHTTEKERHTHVTSHKQSPTHKALSNKTQNSSSSYCSLVNLSCNNLNNASNETINHACLVTPTYFVRF